MTIDRLFVNNFVYTHVVHSDNYAKIIGCNQLICLCHICVSDRALAQAVRIACVAWMNIPSADILKS